MRKGFTLIELMIVVSILGILSALAFPTFADHISQSREAAAKSTLQILRSQIAMYRQQHNGLTPGYVNTTQATTSLLVYQFIGTTAINGMASASRTPTSPYLYGPYLMQMPANPFNDQTTVIYVPYNTGTSADFSSYLTTSNDENVGWLYQRETGMIKLSRSGTDTRGVSFVEY